MSGAVRDVESPVFLALVGPLWFAYAVPCLPIGFLPFAPFLAFAFLTGSLFLGLVKRYTTWGIPLAVSTVVVQWLCVGTMIVVQVATNWF